MSERESQPGPNGGEGTSPGDDLHSLELPSGLVAGLRREFRTAPPVPAHVDLAVLAAFEERRSASASRRNAWRFAAVAASVAAVVWVGSAAWPSSRPTNQPASNLAISDRYGAGNLAGGVGAVLNERGRSERSLGATVGTGSLALADGNGASPAFDAAKSASTPGSPPNTSLTAAPSASAADSSAGGAPAAGKPVELATVDADGNGRVNILDAMRMAKTVEAVRLVRAYRDKPDAAGEAGEAMNKARMAFFVESLDVTWDLTADGVVDQKDADLLAARIVSVGKGGV